MIRLASPSIGEEEKAAVLRVLNSGMLAQGPEVMAFEKSFANYIGTKHALAVSSGTTALYLALLAHGIGPGDEVITSPFSFVASTSAIMMTGAIPVYTDILPDTFLMDPAQITNLITERTRAILAVDIFGHPADATTIQGIANRHGLIFIEDAAQSHGAMVGNARTGSMTTTCFSFYPTKNMMAGEGGMVTTNDDAVANTVRLMRSHGMRNRYEYERLGYNFRMTDLHAAIGRCQLEKLENFNEARIANAQALTERLGGIVKCPTVKPEFRHVFHQYTVRIPENRDLVREKLQALGVDSAIFYPLPLYKIPFVRAHNPGLPESLPETERACCEVLSLPCHPKLTAADIEHIARSVVQVVKACGA